MNWTLLGDMERRLLDTIRQAVAGVVRWTTVAKGSAAGDDDAVEGYSLDTDEPDTQLRCRRVAPWGVAGVPMGRVSGAVVHAMGTGSQAILVGIATERYGPQSLKEGETALYCKATGAIVWFDENGQLQVTSSSGQPIKITAGSNANVEVTASGTGKVKITATAVTGAVELGPNPIKMVLVDGTTDGVFGAPVIQFPAAAASIVKSG